MSETIDREALLELEFPVEVWLASEKIPLERLLRLEPGGVLRLNKDPDGPVDLVVNGSVVASGELVVVDGSFGFRIGSTEEETIADLENEAAAEAEAAADGGDGEAAGEEAGETAEETEPPAEEESE